MSDELNPRVIGWSERMAINLKSQWYRFGALLKLLVRLILFWSVVSLLLLGAYEWTKCVTVPVVNWVLHMHSKQ